VATAETVKDIETKLGHFAELNELSKTTEERIAALNVLAEHVAQKVKALEGQKHTVEHAIVESNRLNEMVWNMDVQVAKLQDGGRQAAKTEETVARIEKLAAEMEAQLEAATKSKEELSTDVARLGRDRESVAEFMRGYLERLAVEKKALAAFDERVTALNGSMQGIEKRVEAVAAQERQATVLGQTLEEIGGRVNTLSGQTDELQERQHELETLGERLGQVEELSKTNRWHYDNLTKSQEVLEQARKDIEAFYASHAEAAKLREQLGADRAALEGFLGRVDTFNRQLPDLDARMNAIVGKLSIVDEGTQQAAALATTVESLEQQMSRIAAQQEHVDRVDLRLNELHGLSQTVDARTAEQVARSGEIEALRNLCDGLSIQVTDAQHKLESVNALQHKLLPITTQLTTLTQQLDAAQSQFQEVQKSEEEILEQGRRLTGLQTAVREVASDVDGRLKQVQGLSDELGRSSTIRDELVEELGRVQFRQREVSANLQASDDQLKRVEATTQQLERRRSQLAFGEKKISQFEGRLSDLKGMADELEQQIQAIATRETFIDSIKSEVEGIHAISAKSKADLRHVTGHREDVVKLKERVDEVLSCIGETSSAWP
jgi:chromosome segregation ATPase